MQPQWLNICNKSTIHLNIILVLNLIRNYSTFACLCVCECVSDVLKYENIMLNYLHIIEKKRMIEKLK